MEVGVGSGKSSSISVVTEPTAAIFIFSAKSEKYAVVPRVQKIPVPKSKIAAAFNSFSFIYIPRFPKA